MVATRRSARDRARQLRRESTDAERKLWHYLRNRGIAGAKFRRQVPIGGITVDFACLERRVVIEVDGGQHADRAGQDGARDRMLQHRGYVVLRYWNNDVLGNIEGVVAQISDALEKG